MTVVSIDQDELSMEALRGGIRSQLHDLRSHVLAITGEQDIPDWLTCDNRRIADDPRNFDSGYSFLDDPKFRDAHIQLLERLVKDPERQIAVRDNSGSWIWNRARVHAFFAKTSAVMRILLPLVRIVSRSRGTELSETRIKNSPSQRRTLYVYNGRLYNIGSYSKTNALMGRDSFLPCLLPNEISRLLLHYLVVIRPVEHLLARVQYPPEVAVLYQTYLFMEYDQRMDSEADSDLLLAFFEKTCDARIRLNRWRHVSASINREFIDESLLSSQRRRSDLSMGHSTEVGRRHYALDHDTPEFATSDVLWEQTWIDGQFHAVLGFGSNPPPIALRLQKSTHVLQLEETISGLRSVVEETSSKMAEFVGEMSRSFDLLASSLSQTLKAELSTLALSKLPEAGNGGKYAALQESTPARGSRFPATPTPPIPSPPPFASAASSSGLVMARSTLSVIPDSDPPTHPLTDPWGQQTIPLSGDRCLAHLRRQLPSDDSHVPDSQLSFQQAQRLAFHPNEVPSGTHCDSPSSSIEAFSTPAIGSPIAIGSSPIGSFASSPCPLRDPKQVHGVALEPDYRLMVAEGLRQLFGMEAAPKSMEQEQLCVEVLKKQKNIIGVLPTAGGKSVAWLLAAKMDPGVTSLVVVPFKQLLDQHLISAMGHKLQAQKWTASTSFVSEDIQLLFVACESAKSHKLTE